MSCVFPIIIIIIIIIIINNNFFFLFLFLEKDLSKVDKILGLKFFKLYCLLDAMFTTPVYLRRRSRFTNSAFLN